MKEKKCDLILVEPSFKDKESTTVHMLNVINGDYLTPRIINSRKTAVAQALDVVGIIKENRPDKVIFDKAGFGHTFYELVIYISRQEKAFEIDSFGTVRYIDEGGY